MNGFKENANKPESVQERTIKLAKELVESQLKGDKLNSALEKLSVLQPGSAEFIDIWEKAVNEAPDTINPQDQDLMNAKYLLKELGCEVLISQSQPEIMDLDEAA